MQDQQLKIRLDVIDNATKAFSSIKDSIFSLKTALIGIGVGAGIKGILEVGSQAEKLRNQFLLLSPSVDEGKKSFEALQKFIASSPLQSDSIERASETVIAFSKNSNDLISNLTAIQNASVALGIDIETVSREFSSLSRTGIDGARELKRKNLEQFLGLQNGIKVTSEEIVRLFLKKFGAGGEFANASEAFANTFAGATNRFKNTFKNIQESIAQAGLLDFFTDLTNVFTNFIRSNPELLSKIVKDFTIGLIEGIKSFASFSARLFTLIKEPFILIVDSIKALDDLRKQFPAVVGEIGILGFLLLGTKGKVIAIIIGDFLRRLNDLRALGNDISKGSEESLVNQNSSIIQQFDLEKLLTEQQQKRLEIQKKIEDSIDNSKNSTEKLSGFFYNIKVAFDALNLTAKTLEQTIAEGMVKAVGDVSRGIAESIVLGKSLQSTFKNIIQSILIDLIAAQLKTIINLGLELALNKSITFEKQQQAFFSNITGGGSSIFGSIGNLFGFGGGGGGFSPDIGGIPDFIPTPFAEGGMVNAMTPYTVGERGRELFIPKTDGTIVPSQDLGVSSNNYNFTIVATDVKGVKELLVNNRSTIVNIMNQALNSKGKSSLI